ASDHARVPPPQPSPASGGGSAQNPRRRETSPRTSTPIIPRSLLYSLHIQHEVEAGGERVVEARELHLERAAVERVARVHRLVREVELRGEELPPDREH